MAAPTPTGWWEQAGTFFMGASEALKHMKRLKRFFCSCPRESFTAGRGRPVIADGLIVGIMSEHSPVVYGGVVELIDLSARFNGLTFWRLKPEEVRTLKRPPNFYRDLTRPKGRGYAGKAS